MASESEQAWLFAAKVGEAAQLQQLLAAEPHLLAFAGAGTPDQVIGNTATHWAASKGHVAALEVHASLAERPGAADAADLPALRLAAAALREELRVFGMVKTEASDMAKRLDAFSME